MIEIKCLKCNKIFLSFPSVNRKFCSHKCSTDFNIGKHHSEETKRKIGESQIGKKISEEAIKKAKESKIRNGTYPKGEKNPMYGRENKWGKHTEEWKRKMSESRLRRKQKLGYLNSPETREKIRLSLLGKPNLKLRGRKLSEKTKNKISLSHIGIKRPPFTEQHKRRISESKKGEKKSEEAKRKMSETKKRLFKEGKLISCFKNTEIQKKIRKKRGIKPTKPEKIMINIIKENNLPFNYIGNGIIWFKGETMNFNPDFLSKNPKYIIEVFGDYWHNRQDNKKRDIERLNTYTKYGYKTLVIWEHELITKNGKRVDTTNVLNKINEFIK